MEFYSGKKKIRINTEICTNFGVGLMFKSKNTRALLFDFKRPAREALTSLFVFFPFVAVWLDDKNKILDVKVVKPFRFAIFPKKPFHKLVEIPINDDYSKEVALLVGN